MPTTPFQFAARTAPGLFITATDTGVGKTVVSCAIAHALRQQTARESGRAGSVKVGVWKPYASGCRQDREGLVAEDAEALAHFSDCRQPLHVINPIRFKPALAPAVAAEVAGELPDYASLARSLHLLDETSDVMLVEGVGGVMVPLDPAHPKLTVLELARALDYPVVIVCRAALGTLNHTALTAAALKQAGCRLAGLVINGFDPDSSRQPRQEDLAMTTNRPWLTKLTGLPVLAVVPQVAEPVLPHQGVIPAAILETVGLTYWMDIADTPR